jgi:hypothetical protein
MSDCYAALGYGLVIGGFVGFAAGFLLVLFAMSDEDRERKPNDT